MEIAIGADCFTSSHYRDCAPSRWISSVARGSLLKETNAPVGSRQSNRQCQPPVLLAFYDDFATVSSNDAANNEQPQTRADRLRRKVRLKHAADVFGRYAAACIGKGMMISSAPERIRRIPPLFMA